MQKKKDFPKSVFFQKQCVFIADR